MCLVKVLTLIIGPNSLVMLYNCSSGKLAGRPLMYTLGGVTEDVELTSDCAVISRSWVGAAGAIEREDVTE